MHPGSQRQYPISLFLLATWLIAAAAMRGGIAPVLVLLVALPMTWYLLRCARRTGGISRPGSAGFPAPAGSDRWPGDLDFSGDDRWAWMGPYLKTLRALRREMRGEGRSWIDHGPRWPEALEIDLGGVQVPDREGRKPRDRRRPDRDSVVTCSLALLAFVLTVSLIGETARFVEDDPGFQAFRLLDLCGVVLFPILIGVAFGCGLPSTLTMIALSAAVQALLFRFQATGSLPNGRFLATAAIAIAAVPLGIPWLFSRIERRSRKADRETTTGKLLESRRHRGPIVPGGTIERR